MPTYIHMLHTNTHKLSEKKIRNHNDTHVQTKRIYTQTHITVILENTHTHTHSLTHSLTQTNIPTHTFRRKASRRDYGGAKRIRWCMKAVGVLCSRKGRAFRGTICNQEWQIVSTSYTYIENNMYVYVYVHWKQCVCIRTLKIMCMYTYIENNVYVYVHWK